MSEKDQITLRLRERWLSSLDTYEYCSGTMRIGERYCVGGSLCECYRRITEEGSWRPFLGKTPRSKRRYTFELKPGVDDDLSPPKKVIDFFGISRDQMDRLIMENDNLNWSPKHLGEIRSIVENVLEKE